jgi:hypothetical protein
MRNPTAPGVQKLAPVRALIVELCDGGYYPLAYQLYELTTSRRSASLSGSARSRRARCGGVVEIPSAALLTARRGDVSLGFRGLHFQKPTPTVVTSSYAACHRYLPFPKDGRWIKERGRG